MSIDLSVPRATSPMGSFLHCRLLNTIALWIGNDILQYFLSLQEAFSITFLKNIKKGIDKKSIV